MKLDLSGDVVVPLVVNLASGLASWAILRLLKKLRSNSTKSSPGAALALYAALLTAWLLGVSLAIKYAVETDGLVVGILLTFVPSLTIFGVIWYSLSSYWRVGIRSADTSTSEAMRPPRVLRELKNSLDFLGTGASKLTTSDQFSDAVMRVTQTGSTVRLLLSLPDSTNLQRAAQLAEKSIDAYERVVKDSLRVIEELKNRKAANIEVRFYEGIRRFRLMFVDDQVCLFSYNIYATPDPLAYPILRLTRSTDVEVRSFYWAVQKYFEDEWNRATPWDFKEHLT